MTKDRLFKREYARELLNVAKDDLEGARVLVAAKIGRQELPLFHVQQTIEKALKAALVWMGRPLPMVHSLAIILDRFPEGTQVPHADSLEDLTQFATIRRYEEGVALFTPDEITAALAMAQDVLDWTEAQLKHQ